MNNSTKIDVYADFLSDDDSAAATADRFNPTFNPPSPLPFSNPVRANSLSPLSSPIYDGDELATEMDLRDSANLDSESSLNTSLPAPSSALNSSFVTSPFPDPLDSLLVNESCLLTLIRPQLDSDTPRLLSIAGEKRIIMNRMNSINSKYVNAPTFPVLPPFMGYIELTDINKDGSLDCMDALILYQDRLQNLADDFIRKIIDANLSLLADVHSSLVQQENDIFSPARIKSVFSPILEAYLNALDISYTADSFKRALGSLAFTYPHKLRHSTETARNAASATAVAPSFEFPVNLNDNRKRSKKPDHRHAVNHSAKKLNSCNKNHDK